MGACTGGGLVLAVDTAATPPSAVLALDHPCYLLHAAMPGHAPTGVLYVLEGSWSAGFRGTSPGLAASVLHVGPYRADGIAVAGCLWCLGVDGGDLAWWGSVRPLAQA